MNERTYYLVETARAQRPAGKHDLGMGEDIAIEAPKGEWMGTFEDLALAVELAKSLQDDPRAVMVAVIEWRGEAVLTTHRHGPRHCAPGARIASVPYYAERPFAQSKFNNGRSRHRVEMGEWRVTDCPVKDLKVGAGNWLRFNPEPLPA